MSRNEVTEKIITAKVLKGISWASVAERVGQSKEWTTAACLGQMTFTSSQAAIVAELFDLDALIHEEFGDGIMSAIDFSMDIQRREDPKGDRVEVVLSGKFLPYKTY